MSKTEENGASVTTELNWVVAPDAGQLAERLGQSIVSRLRTRLDSDGMASLVVSGGSTPAPVFRYLSDADLDWSRVSVTLADERWVPPGHKDSNESLVRETLLVNRAASARFVSLYREVSSPGDALETIADDVRSMNQPFTVVVLGMGSDGHTASLFPDAPELDTAMDLHNECVVMLMNPPSVTQLRITLTRRALLNAEHRYLHITGAQKRRVLLDALSQAAAPGAARSCAAGQAPVIGLLNINPQSVSVYWSD